MSFFPTHTWHDPLDLVFRTQALDGLDTDRLLGILVSNLWELEIGFFFGWFLFHERMQWTAN